MICRCLGRLARQHGNVLSGQLITSQNLHLARTELDISAAVMGELNNLFVALCVLSCCGPVLAFGFPDLSLNLFPVFSAPGFEFPGNAFAFSTNCR
jgi:hypothetical protein